MSKNHVVLTAQIPTSPPHHPPHPSTPLSTLNDNSRNASKTMTNSNSHRVTHARSHSPTPRSPSHTDYSLTHNATITHLNEYIQLVEARLAEINPHQIFPVSPSELGSQPHPLLTRNVPSYILSSTAKWEHQLKEHKDMIVKLEKKQEIEVSEQY